MKRIKSIDTVRGIVMVIMALDHIRDLIHIDSLTQQPTDLATTSPSLFFTRWITYVCAPAFIFLSGSSAFISAKKHVNLSAFQKRLLIRGLWLLLLDFSVVGFGLWFDVHFKVLLFNVLATIGFGLIILGLLIKRSPIIIGTIGLLIVFVYPFVPIAQAGDPILTRVLSFMLSPGAVPFGDGRLFIMGYPPVPWLSIILLGYAGGSLFDLSEKKRRQLFLYLGCSCLVLFMILRSINIYGDPSPWSFQHDPVNTTLSFLNITKYPPSLDFCLCTFGLMFLLLAVAEGLKGNKLATVFSVYGKVPLFYFLIHWYIIHALLFMILLVQGYTFREMVFGTNFGRPHGVSGVGLAGVYLFWIGVIIVLYPICRWFGKVKAENRQNKWLSYL